VGRRDSLLTVADAAAKHGHGAPSFRQGGWRPGRADAPLGAAEAIREPRVGAV